MCLRFFVALALLLSGCRTFDDSSDPLDGGGTTVGNGRPAPLGIVIQYTSTGTGIDSETKARVEQILAEARAANIVTGELERTWGIEGESTTCVGFTDFVPMFDVRRKICTVIRDGNIAAGAPLTQHAVVLRCDNAAIEEPLALNSVDCR